jgi:hypothetical protein
MVAFVFCGCFRLIIDVSNITRINVYIDKYIYIYIYIRLIIDHLKSATGEEFSIRQNSSRLLIHPKNLDHIELQNCGRAVFFCFVVCVVSFFEALTGIQKFLVVI